MADHHIITFLRGTTWDLPENFLSDYHIDLLSRSRLPKIRILLSQGVDDVMSKIQYMVQEDLDYFGIKELATFKGKFDPEALQWLWANITFAEYETLTNIHHIEPDLRYVKDQQLAKKFYKDKDFEIAWKKKWDEIIDENLERSMDVFVSRFRVPRTEKQRKAIEEHTMPTKVCDDVRQVLMEHFY